MNILKQLQEYKEKNKLISKRDTAIDIFSKQKEDTQTIMGTKWYNLIKNYFLWQVQTCYELLKTLDPKKQSDEIVKTQEHLKLAEWFLAFIDIRDK